MMTIMESVLAFIIGYDFVTGNLTDSKRYVLIYLGDIFVMMV